LQKKIICEQYFDTIHSAPGRSTVNKSSSSTEINNDNSSSKKENNSAQGISKITKQNSSVASPWGTLTLRNDKKNWEDAIAACSGIS